MRTWAFQVSHSCRSLWLPRSGFLLGTTVSLAITKKPGSCHSQPVQTDPRRRMVMLEDPSQYAEVVPQGRILTDQEFLTMAGPLECVMEMTCDAPLGHRPGTLSRAEASVRRFT